MTLIPEMQQKTYQGYGPQGFHTIAYTEWGAASDKPPVICTHGLTRNGRDFDWLAAHLEKTRHVFCPDMAGRGQSEDLKDPAGYTYGQYMTDCAILVARMGAAQVDWVGTSMGGLIGILMASQDGNPIRKLVINDVGPFIAMPALKRIADYVSMPTSFVDLDQLERHIRVIYAPFGITRDEDWKHLAQHSYRTLPNGKLSLAHDPGIAKNFLTLDQDVDLWNFYDKITCPVLLLRGSQSDVLSAETAQEMTRRGPKAKLVEFPGVGHAPALMDADQMAVIEEFLRS